MFSDAEIEEAEITISKYEGKSVQVAYDSMMKSLEDIKNKKPLQRYWYIVVYIQHIII